MITMGSILWPPIYGCCRCFARSQETSIFRLQVGVQGASLKKLYGICLPVFLSELALCVMLPRPPPRPSWLSRFWALPPEEQAKVAWSLSFPKQFPEFQYSYIVLPPISISWSPQCFFKLCCHLRANLSWD